ncbi:MAG: FAD-binding oxidoreductase [Chloroflexota bacterium]
MTVAVIGAGLQGSLAAIELARRGHDVVVFERAMEPLSGASRWNEGKIHLGYLFANDHSLRSARRLVDGATRFAPLLSSYLERDLDFMGRSDGFVYAVHRDSLLPATEIGAHLGRVHAMVSDALNERGRDYLGAPTVAAPTRLAATERGLDGEHITDAFDTQERSIDARGLAAAVGQRLAGDPGVRLLVGNEIARVERRDNGGFEIESATGERHGPFVSVVNAAWEQRLRLDATLGYRPSASWMHRFKLALHVRMGARHASLPSVTVVLGPFGDIVNFGGYQLYLSWYPIGRLGSSMEIAPPNMDRLVDTARRDGVAGAIVGHLAAIVPALSEIGLTNDNMQLEGGYIFAWGETDISDVQSGLHNRYDIGVHSDRGYH